MRVPNSGAGEKRRGIPPSPPDHFRRVPGYEGYTSHTITVAAFELLASHRQSLAVKSSSSLYDQWHAASEPSYGDLIDLRRTSGLDRHGADKLRRSKDAGRSSIGTDAESMQAMGSAPEAREARDVKKRKDSTTARSSSSSSSLSHSSDSFRSTCSTTPSSNNGLPRAPPVQAAKEAGKVQRYACKIPKSVAQNQEIGKDAAVASTGTREAAMGRQARRESREARKRESAVPTPSAPRNSRFIASCQMNGPNHLTSREEHAGRSGSRRIRKSWSDPDVETLDAEMRDTMMFWGIFVVGSIFLFAFVLLHILD